MSAGTKKPRATAKAKPKGKEVNPEAPAKRARTAKPKPAPQVDGCTQYARDVVAGKYDVCGYVRKACERHLRDLERTDGRVWFDVAAAERFFRFCRAYLRHYKGEFAGRPIELLPWQMFAFGSVYGWKRVIGGEKTDTLRFNYAYLEVPRKQGKTTLAAAVAAYDCIALEKSGAEIYVAATKEEQAQLLCNDVGAYIQGSPDLAEELEVVSGKKTIFSRQTRTSFIRPLGSNSKRQDGFNPFAIICDELHAWPGRELWDVLTGSFGARKNWHVIAITTSGSNKTGICMSERQHLIGILDGTFQEDNKFGVIYTLDPGEEEDWKNPRMWAKANPSLGAGKDRDVFEGMARKAMQEPSALTEFLQKQLNVWTDASDAWLSMDAWRACEGPASHADLAGKKCWGGMDLARVNDLSAVAYWFPRQPGLSVPRLVVDFWIPEADLSRREDMDKVPFRAWVRSGIMNGTPGRTTDFEWIRDGINRRRETWQVQEMAYDRHFAGELVQALHKDGLAMKPHGQGFLSMSAPSSEFERLVIAGGFRHDGNACLAWNAGNCVITRDPAGNIKPDKSESSNRIDGIVAAIMALSLAAGYGKELEAASERDAAIAAMSTRGLRLLD